ncbi:MAG: sulfotransferase domain-containing protein, partial [Polyangiales bacterium]
MRPTKTSKTKDPVQRAAGRALGVASGALDVAVRNLDNARRIAKFLRGTMELEVRQSDIFISSYPRSGTTLTQWIVYLLAHEAQPDPMHLTKVSPWFERSLAIGELSASDFDRFPSPRVFKSHLPRQWLPDGARYIYVERDGLDV